MRKAFVVFLAALLIAVMSLVGCASGCCDDGGTYLGVLTVINCRQYVTLRAEPDKGAEAVTTVPLGARVEAFYCNSEFTECYFNGEWGYILSTYLSNGSGNGTAAGGSDYLGKRTIVNCNEFVTLRSMPDTKASAVTRIALGETVDCYEYNSKFYYCFYNGLSGYVLRSYVSGGNAYEEYGRSLGIARVVNCNEYVTLRAAPSTSAAALAHVPLGALVEVYDITGRFSECVYANRTGYILTSYLDWEVIYADGECDMEHGY